MQEGEWRAREAALVAAEAALRERGTALEAERNAAQQQLAALQRCAWFSRSVFLKIPQ